MRGDVMYKAFLQVYFLLHHFRPI